MAKRTGNSFEGDRSRDQRLAANRAITERPAFGLTLLAAELLSTAGAVQPGLPSDPQLLAFLLKGALRLEMMEHSDQRIRQFRRLFGSGAVSKDDHGGGSEDKVDEPAWRSRIYTVVCADGAAAADALALMLLPWDGAGADSLLRVVRGTKASVALFQINDVYLDEGRTELLSDLLMQYLSGQSRLLRSLGAVQVLPPWNAGGAKVTQ